MIMKTRFNFFLCAVIMVLILSISVFASECVVKVDTIVIDNSGTSVQVDLILESNPGICGLQLELSYDSRLTLECVTQGEALNSLDFSPGSSTLLWDGLSDDSSTGTLVTLLFSIPQDTCGNFEVEAECIECYNWGMDDIGVTVENGGIIVPSDCTLTVEAVNVDYGTESADVKISISDNPGIISAKFEITYDPALTLNSVTEGGLNALELTDPIISNPCTVILDGVSADHTNGTVLTLSFDLPQQASGEYEVSVLCKEMYSGSWNSPTEVAPAVVNGKVNIAQESKFDGEMLGAQIRVDGIRGLRFGTNVRFNDYMPDLYQSSMVTGISYGTLVTVTDYLTQAGLTAVDLDHELDEQIKVADVVAEKMLFYKNGDYPDSAVFTAVVIEIPDETISFTARGYIKYSDDGGVTFKYHYFDPVTRSIAQILADNAI